MRLWVYAAVTIAAAALVGLLAYGVTTAGQDTTIDDKLVSGERVEAPDASLPRLGADGRAQLADYEGKVVVLNFWGSWCPPCVGELPLLERAHRKIASQGGTVLGVDMKEVTSDGLAMVRRNKLTYPNLRDPDGEFADLYGTTAYPETFVIDRKGLIAARQRGPVDQAWLDRTLTPLLAEKP